MTLIQHNHFPVFYQVIRFLLLSLHSTLLKLYFFIKWLQICLRFRIHPRLYLWIYICSSHVIEVIYYLSFWLHIGNFACDDVKIVCKFLPFWLQAEYFFFNLIVSSTSCFICLVYIMLKGKVLKFRYSSWKRIFNPYCVLSLEDLLL